jgi:hypothetical protein
MSDIVDELEAAFLYTGEGELSSLPDDAAAEITTLRARAEAAEARVAKFEEALTPSGDTKAAYHGEFYSTEIELHEDADGDRIEVPVKRMVPWTTVKEIMAAIRARALLTKGGEVMGEVKKWAHLSDCGTYRYQLKRFWGNPYHGALLPFVMLNPSTADAEIDDPTIRRCMGFARREGAAGIVVANLFAYRSTSPSALKECSDPFGPGNRQNLEEVARFAFVGKSPVVCAWGAGGSIHGGDRSGIEILQQAGARLVCLGKTKDGHPRHPLYVRTDQPLVAFP